MLALPAWHVSTTCASQWKAGQMGHRCPQSDSISKTFDYKSAKKSHRPLMLRRSIQFV